MNEQTEATVLVVDLAGTHRLLEQMGQGPANRLIGRLLGGIGQTIEYYGGSVIKTIGDEVTAEFDRPDPAIATAIHVQREMSRHREASRYGLSARIGLHHGLVTYSAKDVFGPALQAARSVTALAKREQVLLSQILATWSGIQTPVISFGRHQISGVESDIDIVSVDWKHAVADDLRRAAGRAAKPEDRGMELRVGAQVALCDATMSTIDIGRKPTAQIILSYPWVSREHVKIERTSDGYLLTDASRNGTWIYTERLDAPLAHPEAEDSAMDDHGERVDGRGDRGEDAGDAVVPRGPEPTDERDAAGAGSARQIDTGSSDAIEHGRSAAEDLAPRGPDSGSPDSGDPDSGGADSGGADSESADSGSAEPHPAEDSEPSDEWDRRYVTNHLRGSAIALSGSGWIGVGRSKSHPETLIAFGPPEALETLEEVAPAANA